MIHAWDYHWDKYCLSKYPYKKHCNVHSMSEEHRLLLVEQMLFGQTSQRQKWGLHWRESFLIKFLFSVRLIPTISCNQIIFSRRLHLVKLFFCRSSLLGLRVRLLSFYSDVCGSTLILTLKDWILIEMSYNILDWERK